MPYQPIFRSLNVITLRKIGWYFTTLCYEQLWKKKVMLNPLSIIWPHLEKITWIIFDTIFYINTEKILFSKQNLGCTVNWPTFLLLKIIIRPQNGNKIHNFLIYIRDFDDFVSTWYCLYTCEFDSYVIIHNLRISCCVTYILCR